jgi:two-component sensor histidine kinase
MACTHFELRFQPTVTTVSTTRKFVAMLCQALCPDADAVSRIALAVHELLENALKYGSRSSLAISSRRAIRWPSTSPP